MKESPKAGSSSRLLLWAQTARELITANPISIGADETVKQAIAFLVDKGFSAASVIDEAGRPIGILSRSDIVIHEREKVEYKFSVPEAHEGTDLAARSGKPLRKGFQVEHAERTRVREIMTPVVFSVAPFSPANKVVQETLDLRVHQLFVVNHDGALVGIISALDVLRRLAPEVASTPASAGQ